MDIVTKNKNMQTYIKRLVSEHGIPTDGEYDTDLGRIEVFCEKWVSDEEPEYYYEESTQPSKLPSDEEMDKIIDSELKRLWYDCEGDKTADFTDGFVRGFQYANSCPTPKLSLEEAKGLLLKEYSKLCANPEKAFRQNPALIKACENTIIFYAQSQGGFSLDKEELWDKYSERIDDDIDSLQHFAGKDVITKERFFKMIDSLPNLQLQSEHGEAVKFAEASFIAGYKYRAEADGKIFDFASELHAKSHFIKFKNQYPKEQKKGEGE